MFPYMLLPIALMYLPDDGVSTIDQWAEFLAISQFESLSGEVERTVDEFGSPEILAALNGYDH